MLARFTKGRSGLTHHILATLVIGAAARPALGDSYWRFEEAGGNVVVDSGSNALDGVLNALPARIDDVAVDPVPLTGLANPQSLDLNWQSTTNGGVFEVPDQNGLLSFGAATSFTIEAWIRLDDLSDTSNTDQRQFLCQKKPLASGITTDYAFRVQRGDNSPGTAYGKTSNFTGRELLVFFGTGTGTWSITSHLEITDTNWHHVSVACDVENGIVRFGLDDQFETIAFGLEQRTTNNGPLLVGSHRNASGDCNQFLRGTIDELRISPRVVPVEQLLSASATDCNDNGVPDYLDILDGVSSDCNFNGVPDECDIAGGTSQDCQPDGIPDDCQLTAFVYQMDDGEADISVRADGAYTAWLNQFTVLGEFDTITDIDISFGSSAVGQQVTLYVWSDPNGDGVPTDAAVLSSQSFTVEQGMDDSESLARIDVPDAFIGPAGTSFFVGAIVDVPQGGSDFPAAADWDAPTTPGRSWLVGANDPVDPNDLTAGAVEFGVFEDLLPDGNWSVRAVPFFVGGDCNDNGIPDDCDIAEGTSEDTNGNGVPDQCESAGTFLVPDDFGTIQSAITTVLEGSTIIVRPGVYFENLDFGGKAIEVRSELGPELTTIDGGGTGSVVVFQNGEGSDSVLEGFTITNGSGELDLGGGGILCSASSPTIHDNTITGNSTIGFGGGVLVFGAASPTISDNRISRNVADSGGGIYAQLDNTTIHISGNEIKDNTVLGDVGGGIACINGSINLVGNEIEGNQGSDSGGGVYIIYSGNDQHRIESNVIRNNDADDDGGGMWLSNAGDIVLVNMLLEGNAAPSGAGIYARGTGTIANSTIVGNTASSQGGGLLYDDGGGALIVANSIIRDNAAQVAPDIGYPDGQNSVSYCNITGGWVGVGNIDADPLFVDAANGDFSLGAGSSSVDAGDSIVPALAGIVTDLAGAPRTVDDPDVVDTGVPNGSGAVIDMGAFERPLCPADLDGDATVGFPDLLAVLFAWGACADCPEDLDGSGDVGFNDLLLLLAAWGSC